MHFTNHNYSHITNTVKIPTIESAMIRNDLIFAYKIHSNLIDVIDLLNLFEYHVPGRMLRDNDRYFHVPMYHSDFYLRSPIIKLSTMCNNNFGWLDLFNSSLGTVKSQSKCTLVYG